MDKYFFMLANTSASFAGEPIKPEWVYCQWVHESNNFTSQLATENHNLGGLCQTQPNDSPQPDGNEYYMNFDDYEHYARYFGWYLTQFRENGIYNSQTIDDYITALKNGGYFGDDLDNYLTDCKRIYAENFFPETQNT